MSTLASLFRRQSKNKDQFICQLRSHIDLMYRVAFRWTSDQGDAEALVQETLASLANRQEELDQVENPRPWIMKVLYQRFVARYRYQPGCQELPESQLAPEVANEKSASTPLSHAAGSAISSDPIRKVGLQHSLVNALDKLAADQKDVVLLHDAEGYTDSEIAQILGVSNGTVKSRLHRGREELKNLLASETTFESAWCEKVKELKSHVL